MSLEIIRVNKFYGTQQALNEVSFSVSAGEIVGFLGPNGAGKTSMMKIITGNLMKNSGTVNVCGMDIDTHSFDIRKKIGYLPENNPLYLDIYVIEYLMMVARLYKVSQPQKRIDELIEKTGLTQECRKKIGALSKGYRQRVGLAQALLPNPEVLILDEPTTGLDPNQVAGVRELIREVGREKTVILSTHIMQEVQAICERVVILNQGIVVANERVDNLDATLKQSSDIVFVEFSSAIDVNQLKQITGVGQIDVVSPASFKITALSDIRSELFRFAVSQNIEILTLQREKRSMEEVFRLLTTLA